MFASLYVCLMMTGAGDGPPIFQATTATASKPVSGPLQFLGPDWSAQIGTTNIPAGDLIELIQLGVARPNFPWDRPHVLLVNGDRWPGRIANLKDDQARFVPAFGTLTELLLPVSKISVAWLKTPRIGVAPDPANLELPKTRRIRDEVFLGNQDVISGTVVGLDGRMLRLESDDQQKPLAVDRVATIAFNSDLAKIRKTTQPMAHVVLTSGARITLTEARLQDGRVSGTTLAGPPIRILLGDIVALSMKSERVVWLDDVTPTNYEHTPFLSTKWPFTVGRCTSGGPLRLGPHVFDFGIGLHSQCRITVPIPAGTERFDAWVGLDAEAGKQGIVRVSALVEGQVHFGPVEIVRAGPPKRVSFAIRSEAKELVLSVEFADGGDVQDHVNWADARFIRSMPSPTEKP